MKRRFRPGPSKTITTTYFVVKDKNGYALAYVYYEEDPADDPRPI